MEANILIPVLTLVGLFLVLLFVSRLTSRENSNEMFFKGRNKSPWPLVAFGMIGASLSGVSFVSVPGFVGSTQMTYLQMCIGFFFGYIVVAYVLLPLYYRKNLTSIYSYLQERFGRTSRKTAASVFIVSKISGAAVRFYLTCMVLQQLIFHPLGIPFPVSVILILLLVWLYTRKAGIHTLVYTDTLQTLCLIGAIVTVIILLGKQMYPSFSVMAEDISLNPLSRIFVWDDWNSRQLFWKQFLSGVFIVIVMTGLDQDMMQKNLTCANLKKAQKNMCCYGISFIPVNFLLLILGVLLYSYASKHNIPVPEAGDALFPSLVQQGCFGYGVMALFVLGVSSAAFSSIDSALTALTTTVCIDILDIQKESDATRSVLIRKRVHLFIVGIFVMLTILFQKIGNGSVIDVIYTLASYTYGPLLGIFAFGIFTKYQLRERYTPFISVFSPIACYFLSVAVSRFTHYNFGYELLMLNGIITFCLLYLSRKKDSIAYRQPCP